MNREQAETLLAALIADELDESHRGELLAYLKTDAVLNERLGDIRLAARLLREGLEQASADAPTELEAAQRTELLALAEREPIMADAPAAATKSGVGPLFSIRVAGAVAACAALGVGLVGIMLPEIGEARRSARRMQNSPADEYAYGVMPEYDMEPEVSVPSARLSDMPTLGDIPILGGVHGTLRQDSLGMIVADRNSAAMETTNGRIAGTLLNEASGSLALSDTRDVVIGGDNVTRSQASADKDTRRGYWSQNDSYDKPRVAIAEQTESATRPAPPAPPAADAPIISEPTPDPVAVTGSAISYRPDVTGLSAGEKQSGLTQAGEWSGSIVWNDNHTGFEGIQGFDTRYANGQINTEGQQGQQSQQGRQSGANNWLYSDGRDSADLGGDLGTEQVRKAVIVSGLDVDEEDRYDDFAKDLGNKVDLRRIGQSDLPDEIADVVLGLPLDPAKPGGVSLGSNMAPAGGTGKPSDNADGEYGLIPIPDSIAFGPGEPEPDPVPEPSAVGPESIKEAELGDKLAGLTDLRSELAQGLIDEASKNRRLSDNDLRIQEENRELLKQLENAPGFDLNEALSNSNSGGGGSGNARDNGESGLFADQDKSTIDGLDTEQLRRIELERSILEKNVASETERRKADEVQAHLRKVRELQLEKNYDQALVELDAAMFLEPDNSVLQALRGMIQDTSLATESFELKRNRDLEIAGQTLLNLEASTPFNDILTYPGDWPELTAARLRVLENDRATAQANAVGRAALNKGVTVHSENMTLGGVIDYVRDSTGANVAVNWPALELAGVSRQTPITVGSKQVSAEQLLNHALTQAAQQGEQSEPLSFTIDEGVVKVSTRRDLRSETDTRVYDLNAILSQLPESGREQRVAQIIERIKTSVGQPEWWVDEESTIQALNGNLIVKTTDDTHRELARVLDELNAESKSEAQQAAPPALPPVNPWTLTEQDAQSTFAMDTDTASYDLARRTILQQAKLPPIASVRMEEFVNRFDYQYPAGRDAHDTFTVHAEAGPAPFAGSGGGEAVLLKVGVRGRVVARDQMKPAHYVFVIDASGSMAREDRLPLVQQSLAMLLGQLGENDTVSLVSYETRPYLLLEHAPASDPKTIMDAAATIQTGGSTNLTDGLKLGYQVASRHFAPGSVNRVILCSDGVANVGDDDAKQMLDAVKQYRQHGVTLMTVGVGVDGQTAGAAATGSERFNDGLMEQLANQGDGQYIYLGSAEDAQRQFVTDLAATRPTIAYDAKIQVHFDPTRVRRYRLIGYENRAIADKDFRNDAVDAGEVGSGQSATALYEVELWPTRRRRGDDAGDLGTVYVRYRDARSGAIEETQTALTSRLIQERSAADNPRFYLAACAAEFAELLRQSEHASDGSFARLHQIARQVAEALPLDKDATELAELIGRADGLPRAGQ